MKNRVKQVLERGGKINPNSTSKTMAKKSGNGESRPTQEEIAQRARAIYEQSGRVPGRDLDNWLQAEMQLMAGRKAGAASKPVYKEMSKPAFPGTLQSAST